ncbi:cytochrome P450 [Crucibulum laeve]|uniref:Cytochrome P450 n=1 Tax=Crucibulum laeve TaxID=68775 RepID=A0A5C3LV69_9AGAR|nr:cytochrome P450 [Crucibulum laeve]
MASTLVQALTVDILSAITVHLWFKAKEPAPSPLLAAVVVTIPIPSFMLFRSANVSILQAVGLAYGTFLVALLSSIIIYRISPFHPLAKYPGPLVYKITKLWTVWKASSGKLHYCYQQLHQEYGPIVRVGPNELSIIEEDLIPSIIGTHGMPKGPIWDGRKLTPPRKIASDFNLIGNRNQARHAQLRKTWNKAFASSAMGDYEEILVRRATQLVEHLDALCKFKSDGIGRTDIAQWVDYFAFDFMGDLAFGGGFELMRDGDKEDMWNTMENALILPGLAQHIPWSAKLLRSLPFLGSPSRTFGAFVVRQAQRRAAEEPKQKDLFYHLLDAVELTDSESSPLPFILSNAVLAVIAGSDTTSSVLSNGIYYLISHPDYYTRLQKEVDYALGPVRELAPIDLGKLSNLELLNAVINEVLRLQPALPTSLQRAPAVGSGGKHLGPNMFIPEGTAVTVPPYVLHRDPRYFSPNPDSFWPERWTKDDTSIILNRRAFIPFSQGPANCVGKTLALLELRLVLALLVQRFDMTFDDGYDPAAWEQDLKDIFVLSKGKLPIKFTNRRF